MFKQVRSRIRSLHVFVPFAAALGIAALGSGCVIHLHEGGAASSPYAGSSTAVAYNHTTVRVDGTRSGRGGNDCATPPPRRHQSTPATPRGTRPDAQREPTPRPQPAPRPPRAHVEPKPPRAPLPPAPVSGTDPGSRPEHGVSRRNQPSQGKAQPSSRATRSATVEPRKSGSARIEPRRAPRRADVRRGKTR